MTNICIAMNLNIVYMTETNVTNKHVFKTMRKLFIKYHMRTIYVVYSESRTLDLLNAPPCRLFKRESRYEVIDHGALIRIINYLRIYFNI